jgi:DNA helicase-2/ATP-dependent DNA helicase PcrA
LVESVLKGSGLEQSFHRAGLEGQTALENAEELISTAAAYDQQAENPALVDYLQGIALFSDADAYDASVDRIALMTLHAAKGLEFENVFIIGLEEGLLPHERAANNPDELEEERRLFFVGITRAKTNLYISHARYRTFRGQVLRTIPSQFLYQLGSELVQEAFEPEDEAPSYPGRAPLPAATGKPPAFIPGELVRHKAFGLGRVRKYVDLGAHSIVVVAFNSGQTKSLLLQYADLAKV